MDTMDYHKIEPWHIGGRDWIALRINQPKSSTRCRRKQISPHHIPLRLPAVCIALDRCGIVSRPEAVARELLRVCRPGKKIRYADAGAHILQLFWSCLTYASAPLDLRLDNKLSR
jgi:hypothetical protein